MVHSRGCRRLLIQKTQFFVTIPIFIYVNLLAWRQKDGEGVEIRRVIFGDDFAQIFSRVKLYNISYRIPLDGTSEEIVWVLFKYIECRLKIYHEFPIELSCQWIQGHRRCTDWGELCHQHLPANLVDPASWRCLSSQVCENCICAAMFIPDRTNSCLMGANQRASCSISMFCLDLGQSPAWILSVGIHAKDSWAWPGGTLLRNQTLSQAMPASQSKLQFNHRSSRNRSICINSIVVKTFNCPVPAKAYSAFLFFHVFMFGSARFRSFCDVFYHNRKIFVPNETLDTGMILNTSTSSSCQFHSWMLASTNCLVFVCISCMHLVTSGHDHRRSTLHSHSHTYSS